MSVIRKSPVATRIEDLIGATPMLKLNRSLVNPPVGRWLASKGATTTRQLHSELFAKVEFFNPGGSVKDRIALKIVDEAEKRGQLKPGGMIVEATSGNTGAGLAVIAASRGYKATFVMPDKMSAEKVNALRAFGARVVIAPTRVEPDDPAYYCNVARRIAQETPGSFLANQYFTKDNPDAHFETTGPEIWDQCQGKIDVFIAGIGTGGTLSGTARYLKSKNPDIRIVAVDPKGSIYSGLIEKGEPSVAAPYLVEGVGEDMIPGTMDLKMPTDVVTVYDDESFAATRWLAQREGLLVGGSCGFAFFGALQYLALAESQGQKKLRAVVLLPDSGSRYLSKVFNDQWLKQSEALMDWGSESLGGLVDYLPATKKIAGV